MSKLNLTSSDNNLSHSRKRSSSSLNRNFLNRNSEVNLQVQDDPDWWIGLDPDATAFPNRHSKRFTEGPLDTLNVNSISEKSVMKVSSQPRWWTNLPLEESDKMITFKEVQNNSKEVTKDEDLMIQSIKTHKSENKQIRDSHKSSRTSNISNVTSTARKKIQSKENIQHIQHFSKDNDSLENSMTILDLDTSKRKKNNSKRISVNSNANPYMSSNVWNDEENLTLNNKVPSNNSIISKDSRSVHSVKSDSFNSLKKSSILTELVPAKRKKMSNKTDSTSSRDNPFLANTIWSSDSNLSMDVTKFKDSKQNSVKKSIEYDANSLQTNNFEINTLKKKSISEESISTSLSFKSTSNDVMIKKENQDISTENYLKSQDSIDIKKNEKMQAHSTKILNVSSQANSSCGLTSISNISHISNRRQKFKSNSLKLSCDKDEKNNNSQIVNETNELKRKSINKSQSTKLIENLLEQKQNDSLKDKNASSESNIDMTLTQDEYSKNDYLNNTRNKISYLNHQNSENIHEFATNKSVHSIQSDSFNSLKKSSVLTDLASVKRKKMGDKTDSTKSRDNPFLANTIWSNNSNLSGDVTKFKDSKQNSVKKSIEYDANSLQTNNFEINTLKKKSICEESISTSLSFKSTSNDVMNEKENQDISTENYLKSQDLIDIKKNKKMQAHSTKILNVSSQSNSSCGSTSISNISHISNRRQKFKSNSLKLSCDKDEKNNNSQIVSETNELKTKSINTSQSTKLTENLLQQKQNNSLKDKKTSSKSNIDMTLKQVEYSKNDYLNGTTNKKSYLNQENSENVHKFATNRSVHKSEHLSEDQNFSNQIRNEKLNISSSDIHMETNKLQKIDMIKSKVTQNSDLIVLLTPLEDTKIKSNNLKTFKKSSPKKTIRQNNTSQKTVTNIREEMNEMSEDNINKKLLPFLEDDNLQGMGSELLDENDSKTPENKKSYNNNISTKTGSSQGKISHSALDYSTRKSHVGEKSKIEPSKQDCIQSLSYDLQVIGNQSQHGQPNTDFLNECSVKQLSVESENISTVTSQTDHIENRSNNVQTRKTITNSGIRINKTNKKYTHTPISQYEVDDSDKCKTNTCNDYTNSSQYTENSKVIVTKQKINIKNNLEVQNSQQQLECSELNNISLKNNSSKQQTENSQRSRKSNKNLRKDVNHMSYNTAKQLLNSEYQLEKNTSNSDLLILHSENLKEINIENKNHSESNTESVSNHSMKNRMSFEVDRDTDKNSAVVNVINSSKESQISGSKHNTKDTKTYVDETKEQSRIFQNNKQDVNFLKNTTSNSLSRKRTDTHNNKKNSVREIETDKNVSKVTSHKYSNENSSCSNVTELLSNKSNSKMVHIENSFQEDMKENLSNTNSLTYSKFEKISMLPKKLNLTHLEKVSTPLQKNITPKRIRQEKIVNTNLENYRQDNENQSFVCIEPNNSNLVEKKNRLKITNEKDKKQSFQMLETYDNEIIKNNKEKPSSKNNSTKNKSATTTTTDMTKNNFFEIQNKDSKLLHEKQSLQSLVLKHKEKDKLSLQKIYETDMHHKKPANPKFSFSNWALPEKLKPNKINTKRSKNRKVLKKGKIEINEKELYKPCKLKPWITEKCIAFIEAKLRLSFKRDTIDTKQILYFISNVIHKADKDGAFHYKLIDLLKKKMAYYHIIERHIDFYCFVQDFFPFHCITKIVPYIEPVTLRHVNYVDPELFSQKILK